MLLGNPHLLWQGTDRFYQAHLTIPGRLDVQGASLFGSPAIQIGHTRTVAWSHTTPPGLSYTIYRLRLARGEPTAYLVDGRRERMTSRLVRVQVRGRGGRLRTYGRRLWSTRWGPVVTQGPQLAGLQWTRTTAYVLADAAATNVQALDTWLAVARARSAPGVLRALRHWQGIPWNHTLVADRDGRALFADVRVAPDVSDGMAERCIVEIGQPPYAATGLALLDGSRSTCRWGSDPRAVEPGRLAPARQAHLFRRDYVTNSNDSYWLSNPHHPLEGFPRIAGDERRTRSLRTRIGLQMTQQRVDGTDLLGPPGFTLGDMQQLMFSNRQPAGELTRDALLAMCRALPGGLASTSDGAPVAVGPACDVLAGWDLRENLDSRGALLFRLFWEHLYVANPPDSWWAQPFTCRGPGQHAEHARHDAAGRAGRARQRDHRPPARAACRSTPRSAMSSTSSATAGGSPSTAVRPTRTGSSTRSRAPSPPGRDWTSARRTSYVQAVTWNDGPCPEAATILTYSQSANPRSPFFGDQTRLFSRKEWVPVRFCRADVLRNTVRTTVLRTTH